MSEPDFAMPSRLSWSSVSTYSDCSLKWALTRGYKVPDATWFATIAGSAIHEITEDRDRLELMGFSPEEQVEFSPTFATKFDVLLAEAREAGREVRPSGRQLKNVTEAGGPNKKDYDWWLEFGPIFLQRWMTWKKEFGWSIFELEDGRPGIELGFEIELAGYPVVGYIDRVYTGPAGITVFDLKTGAIPTGSLQLKTYDVGLKRAYGVEADWGMFWTPGGGDDTGKLSPAVDLRAWSDERLEQMYAAAARGISQGVFLPHVSNMCSGCTVRPYCWAVAGEKADEIPVAPTILNESTGELASAAEGV